MLPARSRDACHQPGMIPTYITPTTVVHPTMHYLSAVPLSPTGRVYLTTTSTCYVWPGSDGGSRLEMCQPM